MAAETMGHETSGAAPPDVRSDCLLLVDVFPDFDHADGDALLRSYRERHPALATLLERARLHGLPVVYANDNHGVYDGDAASIVRRALDGEAGDLVARLEPGDGDRFVVKPRYSAFDHTPLDLVLRALTADRLVLAGASTEGCVAQTAIAAREHGYKVSVVAEACATTDSELEEIALAYLTRVVGVRVAPAGLPLAPPAGATRAQALAGPAAG
jgi:nicotinamidase-related amidase